MHTTEWHDIRTTETLDVICNNGNDTCRAYSAIRIVIANI